MPTPSLILVPARFKTGKLYTPVATTTGALELGASGDFNVTRATTATRVNASGLIESVASGIPRLDYYTSGGVTGCPALLVEPAATNLCRYSEQFDTVTSGWTATALETITGNTNATLDPAGGNTADLIVATTGNVSHSVKNSSGNLAALVSGTTYTFSVFAKATNVASGFVQLLLGGFPFLPNSPFNNFQLSGSGSVTAGNAGGRIQPFGNGWYRCSITVTAGANSVPAAVFCPILASGTGREAAFAGNGVDGVYLWGAQLETGSVATSYIPTTTAAVTRNADVINLSGAVSGCIGQTEGTIYLEVDLMNIATFAELASISDGTTTNRIEIFRNTNNKINYFRNSATQSASTNIGSSGTYIAPTILKIAVGYKSGDARMYINGVAAIAQQTQTFTFGSITKINLGSSATNTAFFNDRIRAAALYTTRLTDAELATLTTP